MTNDALPGPTAADPGADTPRVRQNLRRQSIAAAVRTQGAVRIEELARRFGVSLVTVHRDLDDLETRGLLRKTWGIATTSSTILVEASDVYRSSLQTAQKEALALAALRFITPGDAVMLDDSTTVLHLAKHLGSRTPLTVITNSLTAMNTLRAERDVTLIGIGGMYYAWCSAFMGHDARQAISALRADTFLMSAPSIIDGTAFHQNEETVDVKRSMFASSARRILLVDHTKFGHRALHAIAHLSEFDVVIVDSETPEAQVEKIRSWGVDVVVAVAHAESRTTMFRRPEASAGSDASPS